MSANCIYGECTICLRPEPVLKLRTCRDCGRRVCGWCSWEIEERYICEDCKGMYQQAQSAKGEPK